MTSSHTVVLLTGVTGWRGSATSYLKIARGMIGLGWHAHLIAGGEPLIAPFRAVGATAEVATFARTGLRTARALVTRLRAVGASVVVADTARDFRVAVLARLLCGVPVVYRYNLNYRTPDTGLLERLYLRRAAGFVFQSRAIRDEFVATYPSLSDSPMWLIPNGYDAAAPDDTRRAALRVRLGLPDGVPVVVCGAMLVASKGHDMLFGAARRAREMGAQFTLVVCGTGGAASAIADDARRQGVDAIFTSFLDAADMAEAYRLADIVVHPSEREIFPNVVAEAMAAGSAVIAVDSWGAAEVIGDAGVMVPPRDADAMAAQMMALLQDAPLRNALGMRAAQRITSRFPLARMADGYRRVLDAVVTT